MLITLDFGSKAQSYPFSNWIQRDRVMESLSWFQQIYLNWSRGMWDNENIHQIYGKSCACNGNRLVNLPIVRIDPNSHRQPHQPIVIRGATRALATAIYLALVVVEREIHEYTTKRNVDNLFLFWHFTTFDSINFHTPPTTMDRCRDSTGKKGSISPDTMETFLHFLNPFFVLSLFIAPSTTFVIWNFLIYLLFRSRFLSYYFAITF